MGDKNNTTNKKKNIPISNILQDFSSKTNKNKKNSSLINFYQIQNLKEEIFKSNQKQYNHNNIIKNIKINRIKNALNNINTIKINNNKKKFSSNLFEEEEEENCYKTQRTKNKNIKNNNNYLYSEKVKSRKNTFFSLYNNIFLDRNKNKNELIF